MIIVTKSAQKHLAKLLLNQKKGTQIRVLVTNPGKYNTECEISYCYPENIKDNDIKLKFGKVIIYIDKISAPYLKDAEINLIKDKIGYQLTLKAPNIKILKPKNDSPLIERIDYMLQSKINPKLKTHGGSVSIIEITDNMVAILRFSGSCNGCSMINLTFKEYIEKELLENFPELKGIRDSTLHRYDQHSYI